MIMASWVRSTAAMLLVLTTASAAHADCIPGGIVGQWKIHGAFMGYNVAGAIWCSINAAKTVNTGVYSVSGDCHSLDPPDPITRNLKISGASLAIGSDCNIGGSFLITPQGQGGRAATIISGRVANTEDRKKTHASFIAKWTPPPPNQYYQMLVLTLER